jgi:hypothetical protein
MQEFLQEIAKQKGILLVVIGVLLLIVGTASGIQLGQNSLSVNPAYQIVIIVVSGLLILIGAIFTIKENAFVAVPPKKSTSKEVLKSLDYLYSQSTAIKKDFIGASQISILGYSLTSFMPAYSDALAQAINNGARVRILLLNPSGESVKIIKKINPASSEIENIHLSLQRIVEVARKSKNSIKGSIEVRLIDWITSCSLIITDADKEKGKVVMGIYTPHYSSPTDKRLHLVLTPLNEKDWFDLYVDQFDLLWSDAKPYKLLEET